MSKPWKIGLALLAAGLFFAVAEWRARRTVVIAPAALPVDRETTFLTEPLGADGRVDYAAALNAMPLPPPEENAALPILEAVGTSALVGDPAASLARLGARADLPRDGLLVPYPLELGYLDPDAEAPSQEDQVAMREWLQGNQAALDALLEASRRPRLALPFVRDGSDGMLQPAVNWGAWQPLFSLLQTRADLSALEGKPASGWRDIQAELRLSRLLGQQPSLIFRVWETSLRYHAQGWIGRALPSGTLDEAACVEMQAALTALPPPAGLDPVVLRTARLLLLDVYPRKIAEGIRAEGGEPSWHSANVLLAAALREINLRFDEVVPLLRSTAAETLGPLGEEIQGLRESVEAISEDVKTLAGQAAQGGTFLSTGGAHQGRLVGKILASVMLSVTPGVAQQIINAESHRHLVLLALALKIHELRTGSFPSALEAFATGIVPAGALDLASVEHSQDADGFRLEHDGEEILIAPGVR